MNGHTCLIVWLHTHTHEIHVQLDEQIELQAKLLNYFLGSNKSNINQCPLKRDRTISEGVTLAEEKNKK